MAPDDEIKRTYYVQPNGHPVRTVKVKSGDTDSGFVVINETDFDPKNHKKFDDSADKAEKVVAPAPRSTDK